MDPGATWACLHHDYHLEDSNGKMPLSVRHARFHTCKPVKKVWIRIGKVMHEIEGTGIGLRSQTSLGAKQL